jgi:hypothetical protein
MPRRLRTGEYIFADFPDFRPTLSPREIFLRGAFGGTYWRPIRSAVTGKRYAGAHLEFPAAWWRGCGVIDSPDYDRGINRFGVRVGMSLEYWESHGWITRWDPYGWVQWYCRFFRGRRCPDDARQVGRWRALAGPRGRFRRGGTPKIKQTLLHWAVAA